MTVWCRKSVFTVALIGEDYFVRICPFHARRYRRCPAVGNLYHIDVNVVILQHRAAYRCYADSAPAYAEFIDRLGEQSMGNAVSASGTIMCRTIFEGRCSLKYSFHVLFFGLVV